MSKKYRLLKDICSPIGSVKAGVIGEDDGTGRIWFENQYWDKNTCEVQTTWFEEVIDRIEVSIINPAKYQNHITIHSSRVFYEDKLPAIKQAIEAVLNDEGDMNTWKSSLNMRIEDMVCPPMKAFVNGVEYVPMSKLQNAFYAGRQKDDSECRLYKYDHFADYLNTL